MIKAAKVVEDDVILDNLDFFDGIRTYQSEWKVDEGLNYYGETIIKPGDIQKMLLRPFNDRKERKKGSFIQFCQQAVENNNCLLHFGV